MTSRSAGVERPDHHDPAGGFRNPWTPARDRSALPLLRWMWARWRDGIPPNPAPGSLPVVPSNISRPRVEKDDEIRVTWVGHATALVQMPGLNVLTDPHWSPRAAPFQWVGPKRLVPPAVPFDALPEIDAVVLSHDHYDHLDDATVRRLGQRFGRARWFTPIGYRDWLSARGVTDVTELDWWKAAELPTSDGGSAIITALPAQHWTRRGLGDPERLWASWGIQAVRGVRVYFGGDSGYSPAFRAIGNELGPFDVALLPIGAYEPRWFMAHDHMNPEEAVQAYRDLGGRGNFVAIHWGTFRLTDEDPLEPPVRAREAWSRSGLADESLWIPRHGETRIVRTATRGIGR